MRPSFAVPATPFARAAIHSSDPRCILLDREVVSHVANRLIRKLAAIGIVVGDPLDGRGIFGGIVRIDEQPRGTAHDGFGDAAGRRPDNRDATRHGFDGDASEGFDITCMHQDVQRSHQVGGVIGEVLEMQAIGGNSRFRQRTDPSVIVTRPIVRPALSLGLRADQ